MKKIFILVLICLTFTKPCFSNHKLNDNTLKDMTFKQLLEELNKQDELTYKMCSEE